MTAKQFFIPAQTAFNSNGLAVPGAQFFFYLPGTTTKTAIYTDGALTVPAANPVLANGAGRIPTIYLDNSVNYRVHITDASGATLEDVDPYIPGTFVSNVPLSVVITSATGQTVTTRTALAAIGSPASGQRADLAEAGRQGRFMFSTLNLATQVTADPDQAIYVAPASDTTGASGAWVRDVPDNIYLASWWGVAPTVGDNRLLFQRALFGTTQLVPAGATFRLPAGTLPISFSFSGRHDDITIEGAGLDTTQIQLTVVTGGPAVQMWGNNITWRGIRWTGNGDPAFANAPSSAILGNDTTATVYSNWTVEDCLFDGAGPGLIVAASNSTTVLSPPTGIRIRNCKSTAKEQGFTIFGCDDVELTNCNISMPDTTPDNECEGIRILGSTNVRVRGVRGRCNGQFGIRLDQMNRGTVSTTLTRNNQDVTIESCHLTNALQNGFVTQNCLGRLTVRDCIFEGDLTGAGFFDPIGISFEADDATATHLNEVIFENNQFIGYNKGVSIGKPVKHLQLLRNTFKGSSGGLTTYPDTVAIISAFSTFTLLEVIGNRFLFPNNHGADFDFAFPTGAQTARIFGNTLMEGGGTYLVAMGSATGVGVNVQLSSGTYNLSSGSGVDATGVLVATASDNYRYPTGSFAAMA